MARMSANYSGCIAYIFRKCCTTSQCKSTEGRSRQLYGFVRCVQLFEVKEDRDGTSSTVSFSVQHTELGSPPNLITSIVATSPSQRDNVCWICGAFLDATFLHPPSATFSPSTNFDHSASQTIQFHSIPFLVSTPKISKALTS